jgi:hypothetical protein
LSKHTISFSAVSPSGVKHTFKLVKTQDGKWELVEPASVVKTTVYDEPYFLQRVLADEAGYKEFNEWECTLPSGKEYKMYPLSGTEPLSYRQLIEFLQANPEYLDDKIQMHDFDEGNWFPLTELRHDSMERPTLVMQGTSRQDSLPESDEDATKRKQLIEQLVQADLASCMDDSKMIEHMLRDGSRGYSSMTLQELEQEVAGRQ